MNLLIFRVPIHKSKRKNRIHPKAEAERLKQKYTPGHKIHNNAFSEGLTNYEDVSVSHGLGVNAQN